MKAATTAKRTRGNQLTQEAPALFDISKIFELPDVQESFRAPKREVQEVAIDVLKEQQLDAYKKVGNYLMNKEGGFYLLKGYAGTGKTFLTDVIIERLLVKYPTLKIACTAPTNKAVKVSQDFAAYTHKNLIYSTIHKLLGLKEKFDKFGRQIFVRDKDASCDLEGLDVLFLDEVSQLNDELFAHIEPFVREGGLKVVFIGDGAQIPPVNKVDCIPFDADMQREYKIQVVELTDIQRQAAGNPIIELATAVRKDLHRHNFTFERNPRLVNGTGYLEFDSIQDKLTIDKLLDLYFTSENFSLNADFAKVIAWTNKTVNGMNDKIRKKIYRDSDVITKVMVGEKLIADKPIIVENIIVYTTNDELEVESYELANEVINEGEFTLKYYKTVVNHVTLSGYNKRYSIKIIHEESEEEFETILKTLANYALSQPEGWQRSQAWSEYYEFLRTFAEVKYNYAITAHKAQGSTYERVFVMETDIMSNKKAYERNRIFYTAITRPRNLLFIIK